MNRSLVLTAALLLCACPEKKTEAANPGQDRLIEKLKAEQERLKHEPSKPSPTAAPQAPEENPLAAHAAAPDAPKQLTLPEDTLITLGAAACRVSNVDTMHTVVGDKTSLSSEDFFVRAKLKCTASKAGTLLDLSGATLKHGERSFAIARDVQRVGGTKQLQLTLTEAGAEPVLLFEVPADALTAGLQLKPVSDSEVVVRLQ